MSKKIYYCIGCGKTHARGEFYKSYNPIHRNGVYPFCKDYIKEQVYTINNTVDVEKFKSLLMQMDAPFLIDEFEGALEDKRETIGTYFSRINMVQNRGKTWKDSNFGRVEYSGINSEDDERLSFKDVVVTPEVKMFWGKGYTDEEYMQLEALYTELINNYECESPVQVMLFKNAAKTQLQADKELAAGNTAAFDRLMKTLSSILGDSNIKPVQETGANATDQATFGTLIKKWENEKPIPDPLPEWEKADILKYTKVWFLGHLSKMLNLNNPFKDEYEKELTKHTIELHHSEDGE